MPPLPIKRVYLAGHTFRWRHGEGVIAVLWGHVVEAHRVWRFPAHTGFQLTYRHEDPTADRHTWIDAIPVPASQWDDANALPQAAKQWLQVRKQHSAVSNPRT